MLVGVLLQTWQSDGFSMQDTEFYCVQYNEILPLITKSQQRHWVDWAEKHYYWTADNWQADVFSDELKLNIFESDGREWCWRKPGESLDPRYMKKNVAHGSGHIMILGCVTHNGIG